MHKLVVNNNNEIDARIPITDLATELKAKFGITFADFASIEATPHKSYLVQNFIGCGELSCAFGPPGSAKSALAGDLGAHVALGHDWMGRRTLRGAVLFLAAERAAQIKRRLAAFRIHYGLTIDPPLAVLSGSLELKDGTKSADGIIECARRWSDICQVETRLIIGDTVSRLLAGGDENSPRDVGAFVNNVARIQDATGAHVMLIHHVPHEQNRMRGHGALLAACDTTIRIDRLGDIRSATIEKNNDGEEGDSVSFKLETVELGKDPNSGQPTTAPVVVQADAPIIETGERLSKNQQTVFALLHSAGASGLTIEDWNDKARDAGIGLRRRADLTDIHLALKRKNLIRETSTGWVVNHA